MSHPARAVGLVNMAKELFTVFFNLFFFFLHNPLPKWVEPHPWLMGAFERSKSTVTKKRMIVEGSDIYPYLPSARTRHEVILMWRPQTNRNSCAAGAKNAWSLCNQATNLAPQSGYCYGGRTPPGTRFTPDLKDRANRSLLIIDSPDQKSKVPRESMLVNASWG